MNNRMHDLLEIGQFEENVRAIVESAIENLRDVLPESIEVETMLQNVRAEFLRQVPELVEKAASPALEALAPLVADTVVRFFQSNEGRAWIEAFGVAESNVTDAAQAFAIRLAETINDRWGVIHNRLRGRS